jgi:hypothetical protein
LDKLPASESFFPEEAFMVLVQLVVIHTISQIKK